MASNDKITFEKFKKMYQDRQKAMNDSKGSSTASGTSPDRVQQNATSVCVPYLARLPTAASSSSEASKTIFDKRTYEQVYRDELIRKHKIVYVRPEKKKVIESHHVREPGPSSSERQGQYTTTFYNITSHDVSKEVRNVSANGSLPMSSTLPILKSTVSPTQPTMEVISYRKSQPDAYAKRLIEITKNGMKNIEIPMVNETDSRLTTNYGAAGAAQTPASIVTQTSERILNLDSRNVKDITHGKVNLSTLHEDQMEISRRIQAQQERRKAPIPTLETFAQNGEALRISKQRSNIMVSIVNTKSCSPNTYGPPGIDSSKQVPHITENFRENDSGTSSSVQMQTIHRNIVSGVTIEPPPAHTNTRESPNGTTYTSKTNAPAAGFQSIELQPYSQDQVLNLDTKHNTSNGVPSPTFPPTTTPCRSSSDDSQNNRFENIQLSSVSPEHKSSEMVVQKGPSCQSQPNSGVISTLSNSPAIWSHLQNHNLQQLLAHVQAKQQQMQQNASKSRPEMSITDHMKLNMLIRSTGMYSDAAQSITALAAVEYERRLAEYMNRQQVIARAQTLSKRKIAVEDGDSARKRKPPKPKQTHSTEPYLQRDPCYKVSSRLPRCRECNRSAAARSRHAQSIFCRFYAFRKLKYNEIGKLEVAGFADPYADPKEPDISLWSSNLTQVPVDLSVEKSKFLLGQVGYKFCELFHQEKEAHFEHLSTDKTIAWKQSVQGTREMCDVCQTTLFNHHWVCATCGFVVCIDCYKYRKHGLISTESTTKDKDTHGWLLCSAKELHSQDQLMLTQIIPSNCLYKLVRQMHGVCALLEIPLNCECPLSKEPLFRKIKDKFEFIYPVTVDAPRESDIFYGCNDSFNAPDVRVTRMVSITIKDIQQLTQQHQVDGDAQEEGSSGNETPIACRIVFSKQYHEDERQGGSRGEDGSRGSSGNESNDGGSNNEKQSYSFEGFQHEIHIDGDHFDESRYKIPSLDKRNTDGENVNLMDGSEQVLEDACADGDKIEISSPNGNGPNNVTSEHGNGSLYKEEPVEENSVSNNVSRVDDASEKDAIQTVSTDDDANYRMKTETMDTSGAYGMMNEMLEDAPNQEIIAPENGTPVARIDQHSSSTPVIVKIEDDVAIKQQTVEEPPNIHAVPYSDEGRFKPSPAMDPTTFAMIMKQMVKFDKTVDIVSTVGRHMVCEAGHLDDFVECIGVQRERVRGFLANFLNDFIYLRGQNSSDDLTNERQILDYNRHIKDGLKFRNKGERRMHLNDSAALYPEVAHEWLCNGKLLRLLDPLDVRNYRLFHDQWERGQPVLVSTVSSKMNMDLWMPESFGRDFGEQVNDLINCFNGKIVRGHPMKVFWEGFEHIRERLLDERERPMMLKLKDWPPGDDFAEMMPTRFYDLMKSLPLAEYTRREGRLNLASRLSSFFVRPDLGPKMYSAYGSALHPNKGTTNLHLDISDAVNVMVYVGVPTDVPRARYNEKILEVIDTEDCDYLTRQRLRQRQELPGALWHIYHAQDADKIRQLLNKIELERGGTIKPNHDPIHDQKWYLDRNMRRRLHQEYGVEGYAIVQCAGDAIFIPAGAPHQVRNLHNCIKVAEDFVSPENISYCFKLTNEFRHLSKTHSNHEDKLQIKNIIYHTVKDAVSSITNPLIMMAGMDTPVEGTS